MIKVTPPDKLIEKIKKHFDKTDKFILMTTFVAGFITNFMFFITRGVAPDTLTEIPNHIANDWEISLGRFSLQFMDNFRFGLVNQILIVSIALLFIALFLITVRKIFKIESKTLLFSLIIIFAVAPQFTETYQFLYCADSYMIALFMSAVAVYALTKITTIKESIKYIILTLVSVILVCSIYQAYLGVLLSLIVVYAIKTTLDDKAKNAIIFFIKSAIYVFIGICAYYVLFRVICKLIGIRPSGYKGANSLGLNTILALPNTIKSTFEDFYNFFFKEQVIINNVYYNRYAIYNILFVTFILSFISVFRKIKENRVSKLIVTILLFIAFPISIGIMNLIAPGTRLFLVTGPGLLVTAILFVVFIEKLELNNFNNILRYVSCIVLFFLGWTFALSDIRTYIVRENQVVQFEQALRTIYDDATSLPEYKVGMKFVFSNNIHTPAKDFEKTNGMVTGNEISWPSFFGTTRYKYFYEQYLGVSPDFADSEIYEKVINTDEFKEMDIFGEGKNYVKVIDDAVVIKTSETVFLDEEGHFNSW